MPDQDQFAQMAELMQKQTEAAQAEAKALLLAKQADEMKAEEYKRAADSQERLIAQVEALIKGATQLTGSMDLVADLNDRFTILVEMLRGLISVIGTISSVDRDTYKRMQEQIEMIALEGAKRESSTTVHTGTKIDKIDQSGSGAMSIQGDVKKGKD